MKVLPPDVKLTILLGILLLVIIVIFLLFIIVLYYRRQLLFDKENKLRDMEHQTQLLQNQIEFQHRTHEEQQRISRDLHDDLGAGISAVQLQAEALRRKIAGSSLEPNVKDLLEACTALNISMREVMWNLNTNHDNLQDFIEHIIQYTRGFFGRTAVRIHIEKEETGQDMISSKTRKNVFLCVKEILNNIYKHSQSTNVTLHFSQENGFFHLGIKDDGVGINVHSPNGHGLESMQQRMKSVEGEFIFLPASAGLHICLKAPIGQEHYD